MTWTSVKPSAPGWWWMRDSLRRFDDAVVQIIFDGERVMIQYQNSKTDWIENFENVLWGDEKIKLPEETK